MSGAVAPVLDAVRLRHWPKNLLVFVPLITSHEIADARLLWQALLAFVSFSLAASAGYIINDVHDLDADRRHPRKRLRAIPAGLLRRAVALRLVPVLLVSSAAIALWQLPGLFTMTLASYVVTTVLYSLIFKQLLFVDVVVLTALYCARIIAGGIATGFFVSPWLLGLAIFFFLSLALLKRYSELLELAGTDEPSAGRGYVPRDADIIRTAGPASGYLSVLILMLYINSEQAQTLYATPGVLWLVGALMIYWITRLWLLAHRGAVRGDPVEFALHDSATYVVVGLTALALWAATLGS